MGWACSSNDSCEEKDLNHDFDRDSDKSSPEYESRTLWVRQHTSGTMGRYQKCLQKCCRETRNEETARRNNS
jgi:hypothetical protein